MSTFSAQPIVIDGKGHLLGRLASIVSKQVSRCLDLLLGAVFAGNGDTREDWKILRKCFGMSKDLGIWD